jgi:hypothetical protein
MTKIEHRIDQNTKTKNKHEHVEDVGRNEGLTNTGNADALLRGLLR